MNTVLTLVHHPWSQLEALARHFPCEAGCGHQVGDELPADVHDSALDTYQQCLVSDIAFSTCEAAFSKTTRLCRCVPEKGKSGLARLTANRSKPLATTTGDRNRGLSCCGQ